MSAIIKSGNVSALSTVRPLGPQPVPVPPLDEERERLKRRVLFLEGELRQRDATAQALRAEIEAAFVRGKEEGHRAGFAAAQSREAERIARLETAIDHAEAKFAESLGSLERLAPLLARDALEVVLGDSEYRNELVASLIRAQLSKIEKSALLTITVSGNDFSDRKALSALGKELGVPASRIQIASDLPTGGCVLGLKLGRHDISLHQQWSVVRELFEGLALPEISS